jgi:hypothetical protein
VAHWTFSGWALVPHCAGQTSFIIRVMDNKQHLSCSHRVFCDRQPLVLSTRYLTDAADSLAFVRAILLKYLKCLKQIRIFVLHLPSWFIQILVKSIRITNIRITQVCHNQNLANPYKFDHSEQNPIFCLALFYNSTIEWILRNATITSSFFRDVMQRRFVFSYGRFGTTCISFLQMSSNNYHWQSINKYQPKYLLRIWRKFYEINAVEFQSSFFSSFSYFG